MGNKSRRSSARAQTRSIHPRNQFHQRRHSFRALTYYMTPSKHHFRVELGTEYMRIFYSLKGEPFLLYTRTQPHTHFAKTPCLKCDPRLLTRILLRFGLLRDKKSSTAKQQVLGIFGDELETLASSFNHISGYPPGETTKLFRLHIGEDEVPRQMFFVA